MDLKRMIGQLFMVGFDGTDPKPVAELIRELELGGVILFTRNIESRDQCRNMIETFQSETKDREDRLLISIDQEGGTTSRLSEELCPIFKPNWEHGDQYRKTGDKQPVIIQAHQTADALLDLGINMNLAPVLDVVTDPGNKVIGSRSFGDDRNTVAELGLAYIQGLQSAGVIATAKHFPGHGPTAVDSHNALPVVDIGIEELEETHIYPFFQAISGGVDAVMSAHLLYRNIAELPATLSPQILTDILREQLNFQGVVITDDLLMQAISDHSTIEESCIQGIKAGVNILLVCSRPDLQRRGVMAVVKAVESGELTEAHIEGAYNRVINLKKKYQVMN